MLCRHVLRSTKGETRRGSCILELLFKKRLLPASSTAHSQTGRFFPKAFNVFQNAALISWLCPRPLPELPGTAQVRRPAGAGSEDGVPSTDAVLNWDRSYLERYLGKWRSHHLTSTMCAVRKFFSQIWHQIAQPSLSSTFRGKTCPDVYSSVLLFQCRQYPGSMAVGSLSLPHRGITTR